MSYEFSESNGGYDLGFFYVLINTTEDLSNLNDYLFSDDPKKIKILSTFLHEYIHFLQEITTTSGVYIIGRYIDLIKEVNFEVRKDGNPTFSVPYRYSNKYNAQANITLAKIYRGSRETFDYAKYDYYKKHKERITDKDGWKKYPDRYAIYFYTADRQLKSVDFGYSCLKEYVTHTIQKKFFPDIEHDDIPYTIVEQIVGKECPSFGLDPLHLVSLCDACLMVYHPAELFFYILEEMKKVDFVPKSNKDVYDFVYNSRPFRERPNFLFRLYEHSNSFSKSQLSDALATPIFQANRDWVCYILDQAKGLRFTDPTFMTGLVDGPGKLSVKFLEIVRKLGTPFFTNANMKGGFIPPDSRYINLPGVEPYQLLVFKQFYRIYGGSKECGLYEFCNQRPGITNADCKSAPWRRALDADQCPLGRLWSTWGMTGFEPF